MQTARSSALVVWLSLTGMPPLASAEPPGGSTYSIAELTAEIDSAVRSASLEEEVLAAIARALERFLHEGELSQEFQRPHPGLDVTTYLVHVAPDGSFSIAALVLRPGARTPVHDHQTWTVWGTYRGRERETRFVKSALGGQAFPELRPARVTILPDGGVSRLPSPPGDVHRLENLGSSNSVSLHVHGADMSERTRNRYDLEKRAVVPFVQSYERIRSEDR